MAKKTAPKVKLDFSFVSTSDSFTLLILGLRLYSEANEHLHWHVKAERTKSQRDTTSFILGLTELNPADVVALLPITVTMTRIAPRELDNDNAYSSTKHCRDSFASWIGIDDRDKRVLYVTEQRKGSPKQYGTEIKVETRESYAKRMLRDAIASVSTGPGLYSTVHGACSESSMVRPERVGMPTLRVSGTCDQL